MVFICIRWYLLCYQHKWMFYKMVLIPYCIVLYCPKILSIYCSTTFIAIIIIMYHSVLITSYL